MALTQENCDIDKELLKEEQEGNVTIFGARFHDQNGKSYVINAASSGFVEIIDEKDLLGKIKAFKVINTNRSCRHEELVIL